MSDRINGRALLTTAEAAFELGLPGPWTLRRLESRGVVPKARRTLVTRRRYYSRSEIAALGRLIKTGQRRSAA
jgi:DNA-binding transcriptional MerR regulator